MYYKEVGLWFPRQEEYRSLISGPLAWDIYFLYGTDARWDEIPWPLIGSGSAIIGQRKELEMALIPLLSNG